MYYSNKSLPLVLIESHSSFQLPILFIQLYATCVGLYSITDTFISTTPNLPTQIKPPSKQVMSFISYNSNDLALQNQNLNSTTPQEEEEYPPFSLISFPSPFLDQNQLFFCHTAADPTQQPNLVGISNKPSVGIVDNTTTTTAADEISQENQQHLMPSFSSEMKRNNQYKNSYSTIRRSGKKDRHSKINTAQGLRCRRMRLSLEIASKFFSLQDTLGFDKPSKTIDWLFSKSKKDIEKLGCSTRDIPQINNNIDISDIGKNTKKSVRKTKHITKEFRGQARARARERTREKIMMRSLEKSEHKSYKLDQVLGPAARSPNSEIGQGSMSNSSNQDHISTNISQSSLHRPLANVEIIENLVRSSTTESSSGILAASCYGYYQQEYEDFFSGGYYSNKNICYLGNWDINSMYSSNMVQISTATNPNSNQELTN